MRSQNCSVVIDRLPNGRYRARCPQFPDCEAEAGTRVAARRAVEAAIDRILRERNRESVPAEKERRSL
jgi:predicted RNase H-like HicB family nuclease